MNYRNVYRALSVKNAFAVLKEVYQGVLENNPRSFDDIQKNLKINKSTLRRITNRLSSSRLIISAKYEYLTDKRKRVYVIWDSFLIEMISKITQHMSQL